MGNDVNRKAYCSRARGDIKSCIEGGNWKIQTSLGVYTSHTASIASFDGAQCVPTSDPTPSPSQQPTVPTANPSLIPTINPTGLPTDDPTSIPTAYPTMNPTVVPTHDPSQDPTNTPTNNPSVVPTANPTINPVTDVPTRIPSINPTDTPTTDPVTVMPTTVNPSTNPTLQPTRDPISTSQPTCADSGTCCAVPGSNNLYECVRLSGFSDTMLNGVWKPWSLTDCYDGVYIYELSDGSLPDKYLCHGKAGNQWTIISRFP